MSKINYKQIMEANVVYRLPKQYQQKIKDAVEIIKSKTGFKITSTEFVRSAVEFKLKELGKKK